MEVSQSNSKNYSVEAAAAADETSPTGILQMSEAAYAEVQTFFTEKRAQKSPSSSPPPLTSEVFFKGVNATEQDKRLYEFMRSMSPLAPIRQASTETAAADAAPVDRKGGSTKLEDAISIKTALYTQLEIEAIEGFDVDVHAPKAYIEEQRVKFSDKWEEEFNSLLEGIAKKHRKKIKSKIKKHKVINAFSEEKFHNKVSIAILAVAAEHFKRKSSVDEIAGHLENILKPLTIDDRIEFSVKIYPPLVLRCSEGDFSFSGLKEQCRIEVQNLIHMKDEGKFYDTLDVLIIKQAEKAAALYTPGHFSHNIFMKLSIDAFKNFIESGICDLTSAFNKEMKAFHTVDRVFSNSKEAFVSEMNSLMMKKRVDHYKSDMAIGDFMNKEALLVPQSLYGEDVKKDYDDLVIRYYEGEITIEEVEEQTHRRSLECIAASGVLVDALDVYDAFITKLSDGIIDRRNFAAAEYDVRKDDATIYEMSKMGEFTVSITEDFPKIMDGLSLQQKDKIKQLGLLAHAIETYTFGLGSLMKNKRIEAVESRDVDYFEGKIDELPDDQFKHCKEGVYLGLEAKFIEGKITFGELQVSFDIQVQAYQRECEARSAEVKAVQAESEAWFNALEERMDLYFLENFTSEITESYIAGNISFDEYKRGRREAFLGSKAYVQGMEDLKKRTFVNLPDAQKERMVQKLLPRLEDQFLKGRINLIKLEESFTKLVAIHKRAVGLVEKMKAKKS